MSANVRHVAVGCQRLELHRIGFDYWLRQDQIIRALDCRGEEQFHRALQSARLPSNWLGGLAGRPALNLRGTLALCYHLEFTTGGKAQQQVRQLLAALEPRTLLAA